METYYLIMEIIKEMINKETAGRNRMIGRRKRVSVNDSWMDLATWDRCKP